MIKLIHTADIHLDASFSGMPPGLGNKRRQSLRDVLAKIIQRAKAWPADAVLIAGDLFEQERITRDTVGFLHTLFDSIRPIPVFIAPGNHDPFMHDSPYNTEKWPSNVFIFNRPAWTAHEVPNKSLTVHGFGFDGFEISSNPFNALKVASNGQVHVGVAHGTEKRHQPPDGKSYAPFDAMEMADCGLTYLALGHFHSKTEVDHQGKTAMHYCGAPEAHGYNHTGPRHYLEIEIDQKTPGVFTPEVRPVPVNNVVYTTCAIDGTAFESSQQLIDVLRGHSQVYAEPQISRVTLTGICLPEIQHQLAAVRDAVADQFYHLELLDESLANENYDELADDDTILGEFIQRINREIADAPDKAHKQMLLRSRDLGMAAFRGQELEIRGLDSGLS